MTEPNSESLLHGAVTGKIIRALYSVYDGLGFGFLESVYRTALYHELIAAGLTVRQEAWIDIWFHGRKVGHFRADKFVNECVIVESKASRFLTGDDHKQLMNYLTSTPIEVGLLLHFGPKPSFFRLYKSNDSKPNLPATSR